MSPETSSFVALDYVVFALMLVVSAAVGIYFAWTDRGQSSSGDFLTGGRRLTALPVSLSLTASFMSAITVLSNPAEVYLYGAGISMYGLAYLFTMLITSEVFLPVFYKLSITSTYEYLELRFSRVTRLLGTFLFITQTILYTGIVIYAPALALNHVTGIDLWGAVISTGVVCIFYCTMGGLKAVVWTDVFQLGVMLAGFLSVIVKSVVLQGGVVAIISDSQDGGRLNVWDHPTNTVDEESFYVALWLNTRNPNVYVDQTSAKTKDQLLDTLIHGFNLNPLRRHTFWTLTVGGTFIWVSVYGINQAQVQRYISCKSMTHARLSLYINLLGLLSILVSSVFAGMCLYSVYKSCDPWSTGLISASDQLMPYLVMDILKDYPGLPGLFVAAAYSGSLSTVSSSINALAAVTVEDLIRPFTNWSEKHLSWISKGMTFFYGVLCIGMAALASIMGGILQAAISIFGIIGGPSLGLFTLGILCPWANSKGAVSGLLSGLVVALWVGIGAQVYPPPPELLLPLPLRTDGCNFTATSTFNWTATALPTQPNSTINALIQDGGSRPVLADLYSISYLYFSPVGTIIAISVGLIVSVITGGCKLKVEPRLLLRKEDTTFYYFVKLFKCRVEKRSGQLDLKDREKKYGSSNPAFCDFELTKSSIAS